MSSYWILLTPRIGNLSVNFSGIWETYFLAKHTSHFFKKIQLPGRHNTNTSIHPKKENVLQTKVKTETMYNLINQHCFFVVTNRNMGEELQESGMTQKQLHDSQKLQPWSFLHSLRKLVRRFLFSVVRWSEFPLPEVVYSFWYCWGWALNNSQSFCFP